MATRKKSTAQPAAAKSSYILNCIPSPKPEKNWTLDTAVAAGLAERPKAAKGGAAAAGDVDLREAWWSVGDQEIGRASCRERVS
jgi:hypothetical protein